MFWSKRSFAAALLAAAAVFFCADGALAQSKGASKDPSKAPLKIKALSKVDKGCLVASPDFDGKVKGPGRSSGRGRRWASLEAEYVTTPDWLDEATFTFHVMTQDAQKAFHYFTCSVSYLNIARGEHGACVMLPPSAVARFGAPCAFGVEVEAEGKVVAVDSVGVGARTPWWAKLDAVAGKVEQHPGLLQDRSKTPFGLTFIDEYEAVR